MRAAMDSHTSCQVDVIAAEDPTSSLGLLSLPFDALLQSKSPTCLGASMNLPNEDSPKQCCSSGYPGFDVTMLPESKGYTDNLQTLLTPRRGRSPIKYTRPVNKPKRRRTLKFELVMPEARTQKEEADVAPEPQRVEIDLDNLRFTNEEAVRMAAKKKGWAPFTNRVTGENGFYIPEVTDTVVYASWERGLQMLPRADAWLAESGKDVPASLTTRLQDQDANPNAEAEQIEEQRRLAKEELHKLEQEKLLMEEERRKIEDDRQAAEQDRIRAEEALRKAEEDEEALRKKEEREEEAAEQERIRVEEERRKKEEREQLDKDRREFAAEMKKSREEEEARKAAEARLAADKAKQEAADADSEVEQERLRQKEEAQKRDLMRAEAEAAEKARKRELEKQRFLRKDHGKQAFGYLAHEGALDRQVWGRPDDNLKRLGLCDPNHVASGGVPHAPGSGPNPKKHVEALEQAVRANLDRARREQLLQEEAALGSCWMNSE